MTRDVIGRTFVQDGIQWQLWLETYQATYPYTHTVVRFLADPTARGRLADAYCVTRAQLGDDWLRDLTDSETLIPTMRLAGFGDEQISVILKNAHQERMS